MTQGVPHGHRTHLECGCSCTSWLVADVPACTSASRATAASVNANVMCTFQRVGRQPPTIKHIPWCRYMRNGFYNEFFLSFLQYICLVASVIRGCKTTEAPRAISGHLRHDCRILVRDCLKRRFTRKLSVPLHQGPDILNEFDASGAVRVRPN